MVKRLHGSCFGSSALRLVDDRGSLMPVLRRMALAVGRPADHARMRLAVLVDGDVLDSRPAILCFCASAG